MKLKKPYLYALIVLVVIAVAAILIVPQLTKSKKIIIGATVPPHGNILEAVVDDLKKEGFELEIMVLTDYVTGNPATAAGDMQANYFQHAPYLAQYNESVSDKEKLVAAIGVHYEPFGLYAGSKATLAELAEGDHIAIPNDPTNGARALFLLQDAGLIKLKDGLTPQTGATVLDIEENVNKIAIDELNAELIPAALQDAAYAVINGNYATGAGLSPKDDALFLEPSDGEAGKLYTNYIVVKPENENADFVKALKKVLFTQKVYDFILNSPDFKGGVIPVFEVPAK
jgi:D-methionine transport system substrate-binding protein